MVLRFRNNKAVNLYSALIESKNIQWRLKAAWIIRIESEPCSVNEKIFKNCLPSGSKGTCAGGAAFDPCLLKKKYLYKEWNCIYESRLTYFVLLALVLIPIPICGLSIFVFNTVGYVFENVNFVIVAGAVPSCTPTVSFFADVADRSPRLSHLHLIEVNLTNVPLDALPSSLKSLAITDSFLPFSWFVPLSVLGTTILPHLKELDLSKSSKTSDGDLGHIARAWTELSVLKLNHCYRMTAKGLQSVAEGLHKLEVLEVAGTTCDDVCIHHICRNLATTLRRLNVAECLRFTDGCVGTVASLLPGLRSLDVSKCPRLTDEGFRSLTHLNASLRYLNVSSTAIGSDTLAQLRSSLSTCEIVCETWTFTVSQKCTKFWNGIAQNYKDRFWWRLAEIFNIL